MTLRRWDLLSRFEIETFLDVGANRGQTGRSLRAGGFRGQIHSFEPLSQAFAELSAASEADQLWSCMHTAVGSEDSELEINVSENSVSSSFLKATPETLAINSRIGGGRTEKVSVRRLDGIAGELGLKGRNLFLKIDTQGFELKVLDGAGRFLDEIRVVQAESSLVPVYGGEPLLPDTLTYMANRGFRPVDISETWSHPETGDMLQVDITFVRDAA